MAKNIVVCCDGTGNQIERNLSNVLKLFRITIKDADQRVYYSAGIGTIGSNDAWARLRQNTKAVFELATGYGLSPEILGAYEFICRHYNEGDKIFLFGFSRGAYTVRAVAGLIHVIGLLPVDQLNISNYAMRTYIQDKDVLDLSVAWHFAKISGAYKVPIRFLGIWDTVASVLVPRKDRIIPQLLTLPYSRKNPSVETVRHAMAIDECRRMFRLNRWAEPQYFVKNPFDKTGTQVSQNIRQVWFAGVHADIGGGYPEEESALAKFPLDWMVREAVTHGLRINQAMRNHIVLGHPRAGTKAVFVRPDVTARAHNSMTWGWRPLEVIPKSARWREWHRQRIAGFYIPLSEPRLVDDPEQPPILHRSVVNRMEKTSYRPENIPTSYEIED